MVFFAAILVFSGVIIGMAGFFNSAHAANVSQFSDTLSTSAPSIGSDHTIKFTTPSGVNLTASGTVAVTFAAGFNFGSVAIADIDFDVNNTTTTKTLAGACAGATWGVTISAPTITFTPCTDTVPAGNYVYIKIGLGAGGTHQITNPAIGSYKITLAGSMADSGTTMVAIVNTVTMTASVDTTFTFTINGVAAGQTTANGETIPTTTITTTATSIPWGLLAPNVPKVARQDLAVATNAANGFSVTVQQNQPLTSGTGAIINNFKDGASTTVPTVWTSPLGTIGNPATYGHYGITASSTEGASEFISNKYAGNINTPRQVMSYTGPADGLTNDKGLTQIGFKIQITSLQSAGNDYTNVLTYVATPVF